MAMAMSLMPIRSPQFRSLPTLSNFSSPKPLSLTSHQFPLQSTTLYPKPVINASTSTSLIVRASATGFDANISEILGDVTIFTAAGEPVMFKNLWDQDQGIAVVALLRHFGCPCCWELASVLKESKSKFDAAGVKLIAIGVGAPNKSRILAERLPFPMDCLYADPDRKAYDVLGLYYGFGRTFFNPASSHVTLSLRVYAICPLVQNRQRCCQDLILYIKLSETTPSKLPQMIEVGFCSREGCSSLKGSNYYMPGKMKGLATMHPWMMLLTYAAKFRLVEDFLLINLPNMR